MKSFFLYNAARQKLQNIQHPRLGKDIVSAGCIQHLTLSDGTATVIFQLAPQDLAWAETAQATITSSLKEISGITDVSCLLTTHKTKTPSAPLGPQPIPGIRFVLAVASGKGGVGKSTTAVNLALGFSQLSLRVGLLDADVYGPSVPHLMNLKEKPVSENGKTLKPLEKFGLTCMSMGFMIPEEKAALWRGPMVQSALQQMIRQVEWGDLDLLVIDLPPGTGDIHLSLCQTVAVSGAVLVSTPQDLALIDARKGIQLFQRFSVPIVGLIENMSVFLCPFCQKESPIFHQGGGRHEATRLEIPFLAEIPLHMDIRQASDAGTPFVLQHPENPIAESYRACAKNIWTFLTEN